MEKKGGIIMRPGIVEQLPISIQEDDLVYIIGHEKEHGFNVLKAKVDQLNRTDVWIRLDIRTNIKEIPQKSIIVLTMAGVTPGTLENIRSSAGSANVSYVRQALTVSEVKSVIQLLNDRRIKIVRKDDTQTEDVSYKKNGNHVIVADNCKDELLPVQIQHDLIIKPEAVKTLGVVHTDKSQQTGDIDLALKALESFGDRIEETQIAILVVADQLKMVMRERDQLRISLDEMAMKMGILEEINKADSMRIKKAEQDNQVLRREVNKLQGTLNGLDALIKGVRTNT